MFGLLRITLVTMTLATLSLATLAQNVPLYLDYQGKVTNDAGEPLADGTYRMAFSLYDAETMGSRVWSANRSTSTIGEVTVTGGLFSVKLGEAIALTSALFDGSDELWLQVAVDTNDNDVIEADEYFSPRERVVSSAFTLNADLLDGQDSSAFALAGHAHDDRYYTETELNTSGGGGAVHWDNLTNVPAGLDDGDDNTTYSAGSGLTLAGTQFSHNDTSSQASANNSSGVVIQDISVDGYGHVTGLASSNLDSRYYTESESDSRFVNVTGDTVTGNLAVNGTLAGNNGIYIDGNRVIDNGGAWHRSYGDAGWYNQTYQGGVYMQDSTYVRIYNNKVFYAPNRVHTNAVRSTVSSGLYLQDDGGNTGVFIEDGGYVGINETSPDFPLHVRGDVVIDGNNSFNSDRTCILGETFQSTAGKTQWSRGYITNNIRWDGSVWRAKASTASSWDWDFSGVIFGDAGTLKFVCAMIDEPPLNDTGAPTTDKTFTDLSSYVQMEVYTNGNVAANGSFISNGFDIAEYIPPRDTLEPADLIMASPDGETEALLAEGAYNARLLGVVSSAPGVLMGHGGLQQAEETEKTHAKLALAGRVPVKVCSLNGDIVAGRPLTSSPLPGIAMAATQAGKVVGSALQPLDTRNAVPVASLADIAWPADEKGLNESPVCFRVPVASLPAAARQKLAQSYKINESDSLYIGKVITFLQPAWYAPAGQDYEAQLAQLNNANQQLQETNTRLRDSLSTLLDRLESAEALLQQLEQQR